MSFTSDSFTHPLDRSECEDSDDRQSTSLTPSAWNSLRDDRWYPDSDEPMPARALPSIWFAIERLIAEHLTDRQQQIVEMFFFRQLDQVTTARLLGISQQSVHEHLYGKLRDGRTRGGIIPKLRKLCARHGISLGTRRNTPPPIDEVA